MSCAAWAATSAESRPSAPCSPWRQRHDRRSHQEDQDDREGRSRRSVAGPGRGSDWTTIGAAGSAAMGASDAAHPRWETQGSASVWRS